MFSLVFQSVISMDCDEVIPSSDAEEVIPSDAEEVIQSSDAKEVMSSDAEEVIPSSDAEEVMSSDAEEVIQSSDAKVMDGVDNSQQENQVLGDLLRVTVQELCDCPKYTPVTVLTLCDCLSDSLHQCFLLYFSQSLVQCRGMGPMSRHGSNVEAWVQCRGIGPMSRHWSNAKALVQCRGNGAMSRHWSNVEAMVPFWTVASSMFSFVFQSLISSVGDEEVIQSSDTKEVIQSSDAEEVMSSDAKVMDGVDNSQQENQVLGDLLCVTVQELCDCPKYTPVTVLTLCDCLRNSLHQCFLLYFSQSFPWIATRSY